MMGALLVLAGGFAVFVLIIGGSSLLRGWALSILWGWFMVPLGLPALPLVTAMGVALVVSFMTYQRIPDCKEKDKEWYERLGDTLGHIILMPFLVLGIGWIIKQFL